MSLSLSLLSLLLLWLWLIIDGNRCRPDAKRYPDPMADRSKNFIQWLRLGMLPFTSRDYQPVHSDAIVDTP